MGKFCPQCGKPCKGKFCPNCGAQVNAGIDIDYVSLAITALCYILWRFAGVTIKTPVGSTIEKFSSALINKESILYSLGLGKLGWLHTAMWIITVITLALIGYAIYARGHSGKRVCLIPAGSTLLATVLAIVESYKVAASADMFKVAPSFGTILAILLPALVILYILKSR